MDNSQNKTADEIKELINEEPELKKTKHKKTADSRLSRGHDFTHTHPSHAKHKKFGMDHEPGAF